MAGIYLHIPFCRTACSYCNFHFTTSLKNKQRLLKAMLKEISLKKDFLNTRQIDSIYFGGGTPSILTVKETEILLTRIYDFFQPSGNIEITFEANPDDLTPEYLKNLKYQGINRLSIGIQSFNDDDLKWLGRHHSAFQAEKCIHDALSSGFKNLSVDLIYGIPGSTHFIENLDKLTYFDIPHFSAYSLTLEPKTIYAWQIQKNIKNPPDEEQILHEFNLLCDFAENNDYQHYEISNFCKEGFKAVHNSAYWESQPYIGIGPSAHSYNLKQRFWNFRVNMDYINAVENNQVYFDYENLSKTDQLNEYLLTRLRTSQGIDLQYFISNLNEKQSNAFLIKVNEFLNKNLLKKKNTYVVLTRQGMLISDLIISELMME